MENKPYRVEFITSVEVEAPSVHKAKELAYREKGLGAPGCCAVYEMDDHKKQVSMGLKQEVTVEHDRPAIRKLGFISNQNISDNVSLDYAIDATMEIIEVLANELGLTLDDIHNWDEKYDIMHTNYILKQEPIKLQ